KNIQELVERMSLQATADSVAAEAAKAARLRADSIARVKKEEALKTNNSNTAQRSEEPKRSNVVEKPKSTAPKRQQPKAVMPSRRPA
ncbi:MAG: hypothetical protein ACO1NX_03180, partial [Chitinophagaceae bacterium]